MASLKPQQLGIPVSAPSGQGDKRLTGNHTIVQWAHDVLTGLGLPTTPTNIAILITWANIESGGYNPNASGGRNNPLNTTQPGHGGVGGGGQGNIMDYPSYADGVAAIVQNLRNPRFGYPAILAGLAAQSPQQTFAAINASAFGTHISPNTGLTMSGIPGVNGGTDTPSGDSGGGGGGVQLTGVLDSIPFLGGFLDAATAPAKLAQAFIALFQNWRYVVQVGVGVLIVGVAVFLAGQHIFEGRAKEVAGEVGPAAAAAAA